LEEEDTTAQCDARWCEFYTAALAKKTKTFQVSSAQSCLIIDAKPCRTQRNSGTVVARRSGRSGRCPREFESHRCHGRRRAAWPSGL